MDTGQQRTQLDCAMSRLARSLLPLALFPIIHASQTPTPYPYLLSLLSPHPLCLEDLELLCSWRG